MSEYTRRKRKNCCLNAINKSSGFWKNNNGGSTQNMRVKHIDHKKGLYDRSINGFSLFQTNQGTTNSCCGQSNPSTHLSQNSYHNYLRRKTLCVSTPTLSCPSSSRKSLPIYKRFTENGSSIYLENKKLRLSRNIENNCAPQTSCTECKSNFVIVKKPKVAESSSCYLDKKKAMRCFAPGQNDFELPITARRSCRHV